MIPAIAYKVPYAFAKANGIVVTSRGTDIADVAVRTDAPLSAIAELRRVLGVPVQARRIDVAEFDELVSTLYNGSEEGAAALAGDCEVSEASSAIFVLGCSAAIMSDS